uniref:WW domain-containing protein n=1 Tax=Parastrongyloides trichosuri TaxID=131310 RepID=A0A0N4ZAT4_PARTI
MSSNDKKDFIPPPLPPPLEESSKVSNPNEDKSDSTESSKGTGCPMNIDREMHSKQSSDNQKNESTASSDDEEDDYDPQEKIVRHIITNSAPGLDKDLPENWKAFIHESGHTIYIHLPSRVVTYSKPFELKDGSARHHEIYVESIPCLQQKRHLKKLNATEEGKDLSEADEKNTITAEELKKYCELLYDYETKYIAKIDRSLPRSERKRKIAEYLKSSSKEKGLSHLPSKPSGSNPTTDQYINIECPVGYQSKPRIVRFTPVGKSATNILNEYVQRTMKTRILYADANHQRYPYVFCHCYIVINDLVRKKVLEVPSMLDKLGRVDINTSGEEQHLLLGIGKGNSKKEAKIQAGMICSRMFLDNLIYDDGGVCKGIGGKSTPENDVAEFFKTIPIDHDKLPDLCEKANQMAPHNVLQMVVQRLKSKRNATLNTGCRIKDNGKYVYYISFGNLNVEAECKNKKEGRQIAAQKFIKKVHPECYSWGEIIQMYGSNNDAIKSRKNSIQKNLNKLAAVYAEENRLNYRPSHEPNREILNCLKYHHQKFFEKYEGEYAEQHINDYKEPILDPKKAAEKSKSLELKNPSSLWKNEA